MSCPVLAVLFQLSCPGCPVPAALSLLLWSAWPALFSYLGRPCPSCSVPAVLSRMFRLGCPVSAVQSWLSYISSCPRYLVLNVKPDRPVLAVLLLSWGGIQRQLLKHGSISDWAMFSKSRIRAVFENRFFPGNIPIPKTFSFNHGSICDRLKPGIPVSIVL